ncbi:MAG: carboxypeptidase regulatory-like domain-containing protein [Rhodopirellula sp.]|nr:carboxypeptidase regulatory-like domain-containing protein [Rhodopirellula sp.]
MKTICWAATLLATVGLCLPQCVVAAAGGPSPTVVDVRLSEGGILVGQVVDTAGGPQNAVPVVLRSGQQDLGAAKTDANGYFAFSGIRGGIYHLQASQGRGTFRVWAPGTAPPSAQQGALVVDGEDAVRSQLKCCLVNPWLLAGIVAAAVAIPVAIHNSDGKHKSVPVTPSQ